MADNSGILPQEDPMPFGVGGPAEASVQHPMIKALIDGTIANVAKPGQLMTPNPYPPGSEEESWYEDQRAKGTTDWANRQALGMLGSGVSVAKPGTAGTFGGRLSKTADQRMADMAETMAAHGKHPDEIRKATGWEFSPTDDKWKYEIPDNKLRLNYMPDKGTTAKATAGNMFTHPDLFKAYPDLRDISTSVARDPIPRGSYNSGDGFKSIHLDVPSYKQGRFVGAHELQHGIQDIEGFGPGSNPQVWAHFLEKNNPEFQAGAYDFNRLQQQAQEGYKKTSGEVEARNVQQRLDYTPLQRMMASPLGEQFHESPTQWLLHPETNEILKVLQHNPISNTLKRLDE